MKSNRLDRKLRLEPAPANHPVGGAEIQFRDSWGEVVQRFDSALFGMPDDINAVVAKAFYDHDVALASETRKSRWFALRGFGRFLREDGRVRSAFDLDIATIRRYIEWLAEPQGGKGRNRHTQAGQFGMVRPILNQAIRDNPGLFAPDFAIPNNPIPLAGTQRLPQDRLTPAQMRAVLATCYAEIDMAWEKFLHGQAIVALPHAPPRTSWRTDGRDRWIWRLHRAYGGLSPGGTRMPQLGLNPKSLPKAHMVKSIEGFLHITTDALAAFYIALLIQTAANAGPLRHMKRDCQVPHPLDQHRVLVEWIKPRAGWKAKRLQRRSFDRRRPNSAPQLIDKLLAMTAPLLPHTRPSERDYLFLHRFLMSTGRNARQYGGGLIHRETLRSAMLRLHGRHNATVTAWNAKHPNKPRLLLPDFSPKLFRSSMASAHYTASRGNIMAAKAVLNHATVATTDIYVDGEAVRRLERDTIARLQLLMITWVTGETPFHDPQHQGPDISMPATALFGHDCLRPIDDGNACADRVCPKLGGCLACPGLIVPIDPHHLARIIQATKHLQAARERIDPIRFRLFYAPSLQVLRQDLLPAFPPEMMPVAERLMLALPPLPDLE
ncbi:site-specific integrase [Novosphingobium sp. KA1]|uniref:site-specific integrase n=1 Tax=Novosphingobium sp. (strain KA1) TaxID=164608 RepID=UPI001A8E6215|nr:site-specific integrase [Novosphingobium sp. KA1]QSR19512.1 hypothetical protein CA833_20320 [Novosphingobium sp. KA1]